MENEIWKDVIGYEGLYQVSNLGQVKSLQRVVNRIDGKKNYIKERILKDKISGAGYRALTLCNINGNKTISVHRLVAIAFIENPLNKTEVNHIDGNKQNNTSLNLEWNTKKENSKHAFLKGLNKPPKVNKICKSVFQFSIDGAFIEKHDSSNKASLKTGVYSSGIIRNCLGQLKQAGGYIWKYQQ